LQEALFLCLLSDVRYCRDEASYRK